MIVTPMIFISYSHHSSKCVFLVFLLKEDEYVCEEERQDI